MGELAPFMIGLERGGCALNTVKNGSVSFAKQIEHGAVCAITPTMSCEKFGSAVPVLDLPHADSASRLCMVRFNKVCVEAGL